MPSECYYYTLFARSASFTSEEGGEERRNETDKRAEGREDWTKRGGGKQRARQQGRRHVYVKKKNVVSKMNRTHGRVTGAKPNDDVTGRQGRRELN